MTMEERDRQIREDGKLEGLEEGKLLTLIEMVCKKLSKGKSLEQIADELEEEPAKILQICDAAADFAPDYDTLEILDMLLDEEEE